MPARCSSLHHPAEALHLLAELAPLGVAVVGGEEADRVVAPVVAQPALDEVGVVDELVDGQQLDGGDPEALEVLDERRVGDAGVGAPLLHGDVGVPDRGPLHVDLVDDRVLPRRAQLAIAVPVEERVDDDAAGHERGRVGVVALVGGRPAVAVDGFVPGDLALDGLGVRVEEELGRVAAQPGARVPGAVDPVAVALAGLDVGELAVPDVAGPLGQGVPGLGRRRRRRGRARRPRRPTRRRRSGCPTPSKVAPSG